MAAENATGFTRVLSTGPVAMTLTADGVVRARVFVVVAGTVRCDVSTIDEPAGVLRQSR